MPRETETEAEILNHIFNPLLPTGELSFDPGEEENVADNEKGTSDSEDAKRLEFEGIKAAETGSLDEAIRLFTEAIQLYPSRASCYNNRAQAYRLQQNITGAINDLNDAITLSHGKGRAASQAYCQRGLIHLLQHHEAEAKEDFEAAARLGSRFAKSQLVQMNPYAAMCNKMLRDVIGKLQRGETDDEK